MSSQNLRDITTHLLAWRNGDAGALNPVMPSLYPHLRDIAAQRLSHERAGITVSPTELVNEAMVRLLGASSDINDRRHFLALAALHMRSILADRARAIRAGRRAGQGVAVTLGQAAQVGGSGGLDLLQLDDALQKLEAEDARAAQLFSLNCFSGLPREDIAEVTGVSLATVDRDLRFARAWINRALG